MRKNQKKYQEKVIVITGGSSGLGRELVLYYEKLGCTVVNLSRTNPEEYAHHIACDITKEQDVYQACDTIMKQYGTIDVLINNAGYGLSGAMEHIPLKDMQAIFDVNVKGVYHLTQLCLPIMKKGGKVINIASVCSLFPLCYRGLYCSSKSALMMMSLSWRMELKGSVDVVTICPADIKTNFTKNRVKNVQSSLRYGDRIEKAMRKIDSKDHKRMNATKVAEKIVKVSEKKKTKPYYIIGFKMKVLHFVMRFMPLSVLLHFTEKLYGGH